MRDYGETELRARLAVGVAVGEDRPIIGVLRRRELSFFALYFTSVAKNDPSLADGLDDMEPEQDNENASCNGDARPEVHCRKVYVVEYSPYSAQGQRGDYHGFVLPDDRRHPSSITMERTLIE